MNRPIRVLVVDDSALMRQLVKRFLQESGMEVVAVARDGADGLEKALALRPDVITLDVEMPKMSGLQMLRRLMRELPIPVVMLSSLTQKQAPTSIEALSLGAVDVVGKPGGGISLNLHEVKEELARKVRIAATARPRAILQKENRTPPVEGAPVSAGYPAAKTAAHGLVVIGSSTGGPGALSELIPGLPREFPVPVVVVQHMPAGFTASLAHRLDQLSALKVREAHEGRLPQAGEVWVAAGGVHLVFDHRKTMRFSQDPPVHGVRPAVDVTLESAAVLWGHAVTAVILTGMGMDGARGARRVKQTGGRVVAQDENSSVIYGMPRAVVEMGLTDRVCGLEEMAGVLVEMARMQD